MDKTSILEFLTDFLVNDNSNKISAAVTKKQEYFGKRYYDDPIVGYASPDNDYIVSLAGNTAANIDLMQPIEWLPNVKTVISIFLPFSEWMRKENRGGNWPSPGWLYGRVNGQETINRMADALQGEIIKAGHDAVVPAADPRFKVYMKRETNSPSLFTSNWSERHVAHAAGLGTFGISGGIITEKGMAGRLTSVITSLYLEPSVHDYIGRFDYCISCGKCADNCPGHAIDLSSKKKDHVACERYLAQIRVVEEPFYGCGKCACDVPCENVRP